MLPAPRCSGRPAAAREQGPRGGPRAPQAPRPWLRPRCPRRARGSSFSSSLLPPGGAPSHGGRQRGLRPPPSLSSGPAAGACSSSAAAVGARGPARLRSPAPSYLPPSLLSPSALLPPASLPPLPLRAEHPGPSRRARRTPARKAGAPAKARAHRRGRRGGGGGRAELRPRGHGAELVRLGGAERGGAERRRTSGPASVSFQSPPYRATDTARELALHFGELLSAPRCSKKNGKGAL